MEPDRVGPPATAILGRGYVAEEPREEEAVPPGGRSAPAGPELAKDLEAAAEADSREGSGDDSAGSGNSSTSVEDETEESDEKGGLGRRRPPRRSGTSAWTPRECWRRYQDWAYVALVSGLTLAVLVAPAVPTHPAQRSCVELPVREGYLAAFPDVHPVALALYVLMMVLLGALAILVQARWRPPASSPFVIAVRIFLSLLWLFQLVTVVEKTLHKCRGADGRLVEGRLALGHNSVMAAKNSLLQGILVCANWIAYLRIGALEAALAAPVGKHWLRCIILTEAVMLPTSAVIYCAESVTSSHWMTKLLGIERVFWAVLMLVAEVLTVTALCRLYRLMHEEARTAVESESREEAEVAAKVARTHLSWVIGAFVAEVLFALVGIFVETEYPVEIPWWADLSVASTNCMVFLLYAAYSLVLGGVACQPRAAKRASAVDGPVGRRRGEQVQRLASGSPMVHVTGDPRWDSTVKDLAHRGFRLGALLDFYALLVREGGPMPQFRPRVSTTNDVVRGVIVPLTRGTAFGNVAYAVLMEHGRPRLAERMVTHHWDNRFCHLVAAVIADAMEEGCYEAFARQLETPRGLRELRGDLARRGLLDITYWICAFSVNQHTAICGGFGQPPLAGTAERREWERKARDTVTGVPFMACECQQVKHFNDSPGLCEMNKFDHMMAFLADSVPAMRQVVAVDESFEILTRAWCVAEINEALQLRIRQALKIHCTAGVLQQGVAINCIRVEDCRASRLEDKEIILAKIEDRAAFNTRVHTAIFGQAGLVAQALDGAAQAAWLGKIARAVLERRATGLAQRSGDQPPLAGGTPSG